MLSKTGIIRGLEKEILKYLNVEEDEKLYFDDEFEMFNFFYTRFDFAFNDLYKMIYGSLPMKQEWLLNSLTNDNEFNVMWKQIKKVSTIY